ncbi:MAG: (d)CMP kinase [Candidatus Omnitrophica bacterium]|nr:(d)CMP kinase [Candidatus Omnitrophota bacterium]
MRRAVNDTIIAIDGPAGAGKSTLAKTLAARLGYLYIDTGAMYRALALKALRQRLPLDGAETLRRLARRTRVRLDRTARGTLRVRLDGRDVTRAIRRPAVTRAASVISQDAGVRAWMVRAQRQLGRRGRVVIEGRDTTTVVFPRARHRFYLDASLDARARRRMQDLRRAGVRASLRAVMEDVRRRDRRDRTRQASPLRRAPGAVRIETTRATRRQTLARLLRAIES